MDDSGLLLIITGKTASGKDTVMAKICGRFPNFKKVTTTTSRALRNGEKQGIDYNFISESDFRRKIDKGEFIEYVEYGGNLYGTEKSQFINNLDQDLIWRIDPSRAGQIRQLAGDLPKRVLVIYLTVDDGMVLKRLQARGLTKEEIDKRMREDAAFWQKYKDNYDFVIENVPGQLDQTVDKITEIVENYRS